MQKHLLQTPLLLLLIHKITKNKKTICFFDEMDIIKPFYCLIIKRKYEFNNNNQIKMFIPSHLVY